MADVEKKATRHGYGEALAELAKEHDDIVVLDADLAGSTGSSAVKKVRPDRFVDVGIAEQNLIGMATGFARDGFVPFASSFAVFITGRGFEIIRNAVCYSNINVKIIGSHCGITSGPDGGTHQSIEDIAIMRSLPNMTVLSPCDYNQAKLLTKLMYEHKGPCYMRTSREAMPIFTSLEDKIEIGKAQVLSEGTDVCIVSTGILAGTALDAAKLLKEEGISAKVLNIHTIKPLDESAILSSVKECGGKVIVCEEASAIGGLCEAVASILVGKDGIKFRTINTGDRFGQSGSAGELLKEYGLTAEDIVNKAKEIC